MADFTDPKPGRKHKAEERFKFRVGNRRKEYLHFFREGTKGQIRIKLPHGEPGGVPGLMENKHGKRKRNWEIQAFIFYGRRGNASSAASGYTPGVPPRKRLLAVCRGQSEGNPDKSGCKWNKILQYGQ